MNYELTLIYIL